MRSFWLSQRPTARRGGSAGAFLKGVLVMSTESVVDLFISRNRRPAPKAAAKRTIATHPQLVAAAAPAMFVAFQEGRPITKDELVDPVQERFPAYTRNGAKKVLGDALGGADDGANTWQTDDRKTILHVRENVSNIMAVISKPEYDQIARAAGFEDAEKLATWGETLPSVAE